MPDADCYILRFFIGGPAHGMRAPGAAAPHSGHRYLLRKAGFVGDKERTLRFWAHEDLSDDQAFDVLVAEMFAVLNVQKEGEDAEPEAGEIMGGSA